MKQADVSTFAGKPAGRLKSRWRIPAIAAVTTAGLTTVSIVLDTGDERARDLALLIGAPTLYLLLPATAGCFVVALVRRNRDRRTGVQRQNPPRRAARATGRSPVRGAAGRRPEQRRGHLRRAEQPPDGAEVVAQRAEAAGPDDVARDGLTPRRIGPLSWSVRLGSGGPRRRPCLWRVLWRK